MPLLHPSYFYLIRKKVEKAFRILMKVLDKSGPVKLYVMCSFSNYQKQLQELSHADNVTVECNILLNETDISNLDLKIPVWIDTPNGNAYFKVISVEYSNNTEPSFVKLQKINL